MPTTASEIESLAEDALREADGDWPTATRLFDDKLKDRVDYREELWTRIVAQELRAAAHRLGATTRPCPNCFEEIPVDANTCRFCGRPVTTPNRGSVPVRPQSPAGSGPVIRNFTLLTGWVLIVLIVILIIAFTRG